MKRNPEYIAFAADESTGEVELMSFDTKDPNQKSGAKVAKATGSDGRGSERYERWDVPKLIAQKIQDVPIAASAIENTANLLLGQGVAYMRRADMLAGNYRRHYDPEVEKMFCSSQAYDFLEGKAYDIAGLYNAFTQHILSISGNKIVQLKQLESLYSRVSKFSPAKKTQDRELLYYSGEFSRTITDADLDNKEKTTVFDLYDPNDPAWIYTRAKSRKRTFAAQSRVRTINSFYYAMPTHLGLYREKGWVDALKNVPEVVYTLQMNQVSLKYIIYVAVEYFHLKYGTQEWLAMSIKQQQAKFTEFRDELKKNLLSTGSVNATVTMLCPQNPDGSLKKLVVIEPVDDKTKTGMWIPDSDHGNQEIVRGHNQPTSLYGLSNSNVRMNTESGSANRQGFNQLVTLNTPRQRLLLADYQIAADWNAANGFSNFDVVFYIDDITHTTTNDQETGIITPKIE